MGDDYEKISMKDMEEYINKNGVLGIEECVKQKLKGWKAVTINVAVIGTTGVGKSSFINAIRGLKDDDKFAAPTNVKVCTKVATVYPHPTNDKINFWDLPGIGTTNYPDLATYCEKFELEKYDTFLIFTANRFTENDLNLVKKVKSINKSFFFIRTKIGQDCTNENRKRAFNEEAMLQTIMTDCLENLEELGDGDKDVFLISNHHPTKWDFARLTQAIFDVLPFRQRECLTLSLSVLTSRSADILRGKIEILRARIWKVAAASAAGAVFPLPGLSVAVDFALITSEVSLYKTQLGLPDDNSIELYIEFPQFAFTTATQLATLIVTYTASSNAEEFARFIPILGSTIAGGLSFGATYYFLHHYLKELETAALGLLDKLATRAVQDTT